MACPDSSPGPRRFRIKTVCGEPYHVAGRKLVPVARVVSFGRARGSIGQDHTHGTGGGFVWCSPIAFVEKTLQGDRRIAIRDATSTALWALLTASLATAPLFAVVRWMARRTLR